MTSLILDIAATNDADKVKLVLIDPKEVEFPIFAKLPHLDGDVIIDKDKSLEKFHSLVNQMDERYSLFNQQRCKNLADYNQLVDPSKRLPYIFVFHDEFADWMKITNYRKEILSLLERLGNKARAAGIYLIFATQRPDKDVMSPQLRNNFGNRLILKLSEKGTSKLSMRDGSEKSAASLCAKGQMWAYIGVGDEILVQCPYVGDADIDLILEAIRKDNL